MKDIEEKRKEIIKKLKNLIEKLKENYGQNKIEILLMCLFVCAVLVISRKEIAQEAAKIWKHEAQTEEQAVLETEVSSETETETGYETETESESETETELETETETETEMQTEQSAENEVLEYRELSDTLKLKGFSLPQIQSITLLKRVLEKRISTYDGDWSVYVKNLRTNQSFVINDTPMNSASVMKLFIMGTVYKAFESGELERTDETMSLMKDMITYSGNDSSNTLLYKLGNSDYEKGIAKVDAFIQEYGFSDMTVEYNGFNNSATTFHADLYNQVAARDCGKLLEDIYRRTWVDRDVSNEIESMLLNQNTRYKIPAGLPEGVLCGNKSGEMDTTENDAAIVYGETCDYILVVLSNDWNSKDTAISRIREISALVYEYLNAEES